MDRNLVELYYSICHASCTYNRSTTDAVSSVQEHLGTQNLNIKFLMTVMMKLPLAKVDHGKMLLSTVAMLVLVMVAMIQRKTSLLMLTVVGCGCDCSGAVLWLVVLGQC